ncbi:lysophosphatidylcholine acyltransferase [Trichonephila clavipes]|nr:lysophosphatidylcholine acyltransferase [Trichonephila clavipes]
MLIVKGRRSNGHRADSPCCCKRRLIVRADPGRTSDKTTKMTVEKSKPIMSAEVLNPFVVKQRLSLFQILKSVLMSFTLMPIRLLLMILTLLVAWVIGVITLPGITKEQALGIEPLNGWRRRWAKPFITKLARLVFFFGGWYRIPQKGCRASAKEAPILLVMPHSTFFDTVLVIALGCPSMVVKDSTERTPFFGRLVKYTQPLFVKSEDPDSRRKIAEKIRERVTSGKDFEQLLLFPEGGCGNRKALLQFKLGKLFCLRASCIQKVFLYRMYTFWALNRKGNRRFSYETLAFN